MFTVSVPAMLSKPVWGYFIDRSPAKPLAAISAAVTGLALFLIVLACLSGVCLGPFSLRRSRIWMGRYDSFAGGNLGVVFW